jgi:peptide deformylase
MKYLSDELNLVSIVDPILKIAPKKFDFDENDGKEIASKLRLKMSELGGVGLSANQVGLDMSVMVLGVRNPKNDEQFERVCFNPVMIGASDQQIMMQEGCLSIPGLRLNIKRPKTCTITYFDAEQKEHTERFLGLAARIALHEYDHMLGFNFMSRVSKFKLDRAMKSLNKRVKAFNRRH